MSDLTLREQFTLVLRAMPEFYLNAPNRWLMRHHRPEDVGDGHILCLNHRRAQDWPCKEWTYAAERNAEWVQRRKTTR